MELNINKIFIDSEEKIREGIANFSMLNCRKNYVQYIKAETNNEFEEKFVRALEDSLDDLCLTIFKKRIEGLSKKELIADLIEAERNGVYGINDRDIESLYEYLEYNVTDKESYEIIKTHMEVTLDTLIMNLNKTKKDKIIDSKKRELENIERNIKYYEKCIADKAKLEAELNELTK